MIVSEKELCKSNKAGSSSSKRLGKAIIALLVICLIMLIMIYSKKGTSSGELIKQQIELSSKATDDKISKLSSQMGALTDKNYEQQIKLIETLNVNSQKQMPAPQAQEVTP